MAKTPKKTPTEGEPPVAELSALQKQVWAKDLYLLGNTTTQICAKVGTDSRTLNKWIEDNNWKSLRAYLHVDTSVMRGKLLLLIENQIDKAIQDGEFGAFDKEAGNFAKLLDQLTDDNIASKAVAVFKRFYDFLDTEAKIDDRITNEFIVLLDELQDNFRRANS